MVSRQRRRVAMLGGLWVVLVVSCAIWASVGIETSPMADNSTAEGRAINRRIEFTLGSIQGGS